MKWQGRRRSSNVEDRRGRGAARGPIAGGRGMRLGGGIGGIGLIALVVMFLLGGDPIQLLGALLGGGGDVVSTTPSSASARPSGQAATANPEQTAFVEVVLADTEDTWNQLFRQYGTQYREPSLVLFDGGVNSACGYNTTATGPFYCPGDQKLYLDLGFFRELDRLGAHGDFARAYVIGHEVAHHVQNITGVFNSLRPLQARSGKADSNALQVLAELQADCYAGVWAHHAATQRGLLEEGDVEEGLQAAASIGDDRLQRRAGRRVQPESFTHGSSRQRVQWFRTGLAQGDVGACDTFSQAGVKL